MATHLATPQPPVSTLETSRALFYQDVQNRNGVTRTEAEQVLAVLDQLIAWNPERLVYMPHNPKLDKKANVVKFGQNPTGQAFWAAHPGPIYGAKLVVLPQITEEMESLRTTVRDLFNEIDHGAWKKAHADDLVPTLEFRYLRFPRDFDRVAKIMTDALDTLDTLATVE